MPIHVAITRKVLPGREEEFKQALRRFLGESFGHGGVQGAGMITALPGADNREIGILRTFADEAERDAFYGSQMYRDWNEYAKTLTEGEMVSRELGGLEAWFRAPGAPPRWKMAVATLAGVFPTSLFLMLAIGPYIITLPVLVRAMVMSVLMVALLTWVVMPNVIRVMKKWLHAG